MKAQNKKIQLHFIAQEATTRPDYESTYCQLRAAGFKNFSLSTACFCFQQLYLLLNDSGEVDSDSKQLLYKTCYEDHGTKLEITDMTSGFKINLFHDFLQRKKYLDQGNGVLMNIGTQPHDFAYAKFWDRDGATVGHVLKMDDPFPKHQVIDALRDRARFKKEIAPFMPEENFIEDASMALRASNEPFSAPAQASVVSPAPAPVAQPAILPAAPVAAPAQSFLQRSVHAVYKHRKALIAAGVVAGLVINRKKIIDALQRKLLPA